MADIIWKSSERGVIDGAPDRVVAKDREALLIIVAREESHEGEVGLALPNEERGNAATTLVYDGYQRTLVRMGATIITVLIKTGNFRDATAMALKMLAGEDGKSEVKVAVDGETVPDMTLDALMEAIASRKPPERRRDVR